MMECKHCGLFDAEGKLRRGLKQKGKTKTEGTRGERRYVCQDCGAETVLTFDASTRQHAEAPVLKGIRGGKA